jgi:beta-barrel assembly-enhancing protease
MPGPRLENRLPDEGINSSTEHPLKEFAWLVGAALVTLAVVVAAVAWGARWAAPKLPFSYEVDLARRVIDQRPQTPADAARSAALQTVADKVASTMALPAGMTITVRYVDEPVVNAYATIGGQVRVYRGLLEKLRSEDALAALLAHEIGHVKHRHVAANVGRGLAVAMLLGVISSDAGGAVAQQVLGQAASVALLSYSRDQESECDAEAIDSVVALYGHGAGFEALFNAMRDAEQERQRKMPGVAIERLRSHPLTETRIEQARERAQSMGWVTSGRESPMPAALVLEPAPKK